METFTENTNRWMVPNDRQLALRGRLETGWSSYTTPLKTFAQQNATCNLTEEEQHMILQVLRKNEVIQVQEQRRIGKLIKRLEHMKESILGDGRSTCLICGTKDGCLRDQLHFCAHCGKMVCKKCSVEVRSSLNKCGGCSLCVLCNEDKMLWRRSGAWFYNTIPIYVVQENTPPFSHEEEQQSDISDSPPLYKDTTFVDMQRSRGGSTNDGSDDSDFESSSAIPEDKMSMAHSNINTDEDCVSGGSSSTLTDVKLDNSSSSANDSRCSSTDILTQSQDKNFCLLTERSTYMTRARANTTDSSKMNNSRGPSRKTSLEVESENARARHISIVPSSPNDGQNIEQDARSSRSNSTVSEQEDIDAMFESYEAEEKGQKEYHGKFGMIEFTVQYDANTQELLVILASCKGLRKTDKETPLNPYVKAVIIPIDPQAAKASKKRSPVVKKSCDPVFNYSIVYPGISGEDMENKGIKLSVMDESSFGHDIVIGETCVPLKGLTTRTMQQFRRILEAQANDDMVFLDTKKGDSNPGRIELALHYLSKQQKLVVGIIRCVGLKALDQNGYSDPFVKCYLLPDPQRKTKRKTVVRKKTLNPEWHQEFQYDISHAELAKRTLSISVWDYDSGKANDFIGSLTVGIDSGGDVLRHWFDTLKKADRRVIRWHTLSDSEPLIE